PIRFGIQNVDLMKPKLSMMKSFITAILLIIASALNAQSIVGKWKTIDDETGKPKSVVEIYKKGDVYEGKILKLFRDPNEEQDPICDECDEDDPRHNQRVLGMVIIKDMKYYPEDKELNDGTILDPKNGT